ncbi:nitroreductase family protein, partial [Sinorhizobium medicae]
HPQPAMTASLSEFAEPSAHYPEIPMKPMYLPAMARIFRTASITTRPWKIRSLTCPCDTLPSAETVLGGQDWFSGASALILLVANFARTAWKYRHPAGFRGVLIEAGHIAQNMLLAATANGLVATPTCALDDNVIEIMLDIDPVMQSPIYAVAVGTHSATATIADLVGWSAVEHQQ